MIENLSKTNPILKSHKSGETTILFTKKALDHILEQHSESQGTESAISKGKIYFFDSDEILTLAEKITQELSSEIEYERSQGVYISYTPYFINPIIYRPFSTNLIVQLKINKRNYFEIISFYKKRDLSKRDLKRRS